MIFNINLLGYSVVSCGLERETEMKTKKGMKENFFT